MVVRMTERDYLCPNCGIWNEKIQVSQIVADGLRSDCDNPCHPLYPLYPRGADFELAHAWHDTYNNQIVISRRIHICRVGSLSYTFGSLRRSNFTYQAPADRQAPLFTYSGCLWLFMAIYGTFVSFRLHFLPLELICEYVPVCCDELGVDIIYWHWSSIRRHQLGDFADKTESIIDHFNSVEVFSIVNYPPIPHSHSCVWRILPHLDGMWLW